MACLHQTLGGRSGRPLTHSSYTTIRDTTVALQPVQQQPAPSASNFTTTLMNNTSEIAGPAATPGEQTFGTVFLLGKPMKADPKNAYFVLVTAAHVLDEISGNQATLLMRRKDENGSFTPFLFPLNIRNSEGQSLCEEPYADVAAMYVQVPDVAIFGLMSISLLANDARINQLEIHPGDELQCLGFPLAINLNGFPVIRSGLLASYPITPTESVHTLYYNFHVFPGNSGGPVYFIFPNRSYQGQAHIGDDEWGIIGLVAQQVSSKIPDFEKTPLDISVIVPSSYIIDTINMLPDEGLQ